MKEQGVVELEKRWAFVRCPLCAWEGVIWSTNQQRKAAMDDWFRHKELHTRFGPIFVQVEQPPAELLAKQ